MMSSPERSDTPLTLVLVGPMAAGKTSVGRRVARLLEVPVVDTDKRIAAEHGAIPQIFAEHGEPYFRARERDAVAAAVAEGGVVSLGGGAVTDAGTRALLAEHPVVFLTVSPESVARRIAGTGRPLLAGTGDPVERWRTIFDERRSWYEEVADLTVDTSHRPMRMLAEEIAAWRKEQA
jgi:shikimate kinase